MDPGGPPAPARHRHRRGGKKTEGNIIQ